MVKLERKHWFLGPFICFLKGKKNLKQVISSHSFTWQTLTEHQPFAVCEILLTKEIKPM